MKAKSEELLWMLFWTGEVLLRPTFRNLTDSFECWAYRNGFHRQLQRMQSQRLVETEVTSAGDRLYRLTAHGQSRALESQDPAKRWDRKWDGRWRLILFDVPEKLTVTRNRLRRYLKERGYGCLQYSAWITPDPVEEESELLARQAVNVKSLIFLEAQPCAGESDAAIVNAAWDFNAINECYTQHQQVLARRPKGRLESPGSAKAFHRWFREENSAWRAALRLDPLLPRPLLPKRYAGIGALKRRQKILRIASNQMRSFSLRKNPGDN